MKTTTEINLSDLYKDKAAGNETSSGTTPLQNPEVEESLFKFKQALIGLIKKDFTYVVITNKTENTSEKTPYYQIIVSKKNILIKDVIGTVVQRNITYQWNSTIVTVDGQPGDLALINDYFEKMSIDIDNNQVEMFNV